MAKGYETKDETETLERWKRREKLSEGIRKERTGKGEGKCQKGYVMKGGERGVSEGIL